MADMENVLETYAEASDPQQPMPCMDERPVQLLNRTKVPIAATKKHAKRVDYEYERNGNASIFLFAEPLSGFRRATARERRTKVDWAIEVAKLLDTRYSAREKVTLVCDNLNTHEGSVLHGVPTQASAGVCKAEQFLPHTQTTSMPERPPHRRTAAAAIRDRDLGRQDHRQTTRRGLAIKVDDP